MNFTEGKFQAQGLQLAYKRWGEGNTHKVIALHGWLDNAASFDFLAPYLHDFDLVCIEGMKRLSRFEKNKVCNVNDVIYWGKPNGSQSLLKPFR